MQQHLKKDLKNDFSNTETLPSKPYPSVSSGEFQVLNRLDSDHHTVKFLKTGHIRKARTDAIRKGQIKDPYYPSVYGVGFLGEGAHKMSYKGKHSLVYKTWRNMLCRCYCPLLHARQPTYGDCEVCLEWHNFQNFAEWFEKNHIKGYHLDKDKLVKGNRIYSPETCCFISRAENAAISSAATFTVYNPEGHPITVHNMAEFCRENGLNNQCMSMVIRGKQHQHKGWRAHPMIED